MAKIAFWPKQDGYISGWDANRNFMATFMVENLSNSWCVEAKLQLGYSDCPDYTFFDAGPWVPLKAKGYPGEGIVLTSTDAAEYARVLIRGEGGECLLVHPRTKER